MEYFSIFFKEKPRRRQAFLWRALSSFFVYIFIASAQPNSASAHIGAPEGRAPFLMDDDLVGGGTTWGLVHRADEQWRRVCEEAIGEPPNFRFRNNDGRIFLGTSAGLLYTDDFGCSYAQASELFANKKVSTLAIPHSMPSRIYVATASPEGDNGIYRSDDNGNSFFPLGIQGVEAYILSILTNDSGSDVYVSTYSGADQSIAIYHSTDSGMSFTVADIVPEDAIYFTLIGYDHIQDRIALSSVVFGEPGGKLYFADPSLDSVTLDSSYTSVPTTYVRYESYEFLLLAFSTLNRRSMNDTGEPFTPIEDSAARCIMHSPYDGRLWRCGLSYQFGHFLSTSDGETWDIHMRYLDMIEHQCPEGTVGADRCAYLFSDGGFIDDGGAERDAGAIPDGGLEPSSDAGQNLDGGGESANLDASTGSTPRPDDYGCACAQSISTNNESPGSGPEGVLALWAILIFRYSKRKRRRDSQ
jgi:hypothetical protein